MTESFDYPRLLQRALRSVVRDVLTVAAAEGLPGEHHFYLSLRTDRNDVRLPTFLRQRYPEEMTVVLQNQFWDLQVDDEGFGVTLKFDGQPARIEAPFAAVVAFFDPAAQFGLRFDLAGLGGTTPVTGPVKAEAGGLAAVAAASDAPSGDPPDEPEADAEETDAGLPPATRETDGKAAGEAKVLSFDRARDRRDPEPG